MAQEMGIGALGDQNIVFKRKFRWTFAVNNICSKDNKKLQLPPNFVKIASRPSLTIEETEINYLNARSYIPGKGVWNTVTVTYLDVANISNMDRKVAGDPNALFTWIYDVYDFRSKIDGASSENQLNMGSRRSDYSASGLLTMYDGCGGTIEFWNLDDCFPTEVNFGDLDYSSNDIAEIELTLRFSNARRTAMCGSNPPAPCCTPCNS